MLIISLESDSFAVSNGHLVISGKMLNLIQDKMNENCLVEIVFSDSDFEKFSDALKKT